MFSVSQLHSQAPGAHPFCRWPPRTTTQRPEAVQVVLSLAGHPGPAAGVPRDPALHDRRQLHCGRRLWAGLPRDLPRTGRGHQRAHLVQRRPAGGGQVQGGGQGVLAAQQQPGVCASAGGLHRATKALPGGGVHV
eukprot:scaffold204562_cov35-Prasinocladus_malaysianus.AAC.1